MFPQKSFGSDNHSGVHPRIMQAMVEANQGHAPAYGDDHLTPKALELFARHFGPKASGHFVFLGTAANVLAIRAVTRSFHAVICAHTAHINEDECGAPEKIAGVKLLQIHTDNGKITPEDIPPFLNSLGFEHHSQPRLVSITQSTELGTVYTPEEIKALVDTAHNHGLLLHMDGARLANAAASLDVSLAALTTDLGVDLLSFGGTKNGLCFGEAVIFLKPGLDADFPYLRKQNMQLASKMRFIAAQFVALLEDDLWLANARQSNAMASLLGQELERRGATLAHPVQSNAVFVQLPREIIKRLQERYLFYTWRPDVRPGVDEARLMCSFDTEEADVLEFVRIFEETTRRS